ncbi:MAG: hypothetical protein JXJ04_21345 [Spirochaetales bacterium]|nr:hypothetical protein [Spirochaetales bacterium]
MHKLIPLSICFIFVIMTLSSCVMNIAAIQDNPQKYSGKKISLSGEIESVINIPFTDLYVFVFKDSTGSAVVFSEKKHEKGDSLILYGTVTAFSGEELKGGSKKAAAKLKSFLIEHDFVEKEIAQGVAEIIINTAQGIAGGLEKIFFIIED